MSPAQATSSRLPDLRHVSRPRSRAARRSRAVRGFRGRPSRCGRDGRRPGAGRDHRRARGRRARTGSSRFSSAPRRSSSRSRPDLEVVHAPQVVGMHEKPADAAREKRDSSLFAACRAVGRGEADVVVSAGNTGAMLAAGLLEIGRLPEVSRPAIAAPIPARRGPSILIDAGANADARPEHLLQFAHMGTIFAEEIIGIRGPDGRAALDRRGAGEGQPAHPRGAPPAVRGRNPVRRERRRAAPAGGRRGRRRLRRLHGQHVAQGARGHDPDGARVAPRGDRRLAGAGRSAVS